VLFNYWAVYTHPDTMMPTLRDGTAAAALFSLAPKFEQAFREALGLPCLTPADTTAVTGAPAQSP
jgi:hypothetical protein